MPPSPWMSVMPVAFAVFGLLFIVLGVAQVRGDRRRRRDWRPLSGRVVASRLDDGHFQAQVAYVLDGREFIFWNRNTSSSITDPVGREVEVLVNPNDPADAVVNAGTTGGLALGVGLVAVGAIAIVFGLRFR